MNGLYPVRPVSLQNIPKQAEKRVEWKESLKSLNYAQAAAEKES